MNTSSSMLARIAILSAALSATSSTFLLGALMTLNYARETGYLSSQAFEGGQGFSFNFPYWLIIFFALATTAGTMMLIVMSHYLESRPWLCWDHILALGFITPFPLVIAIKHLT